MKYSEDLIEQCQTAFLQRLPVSEIAQTYRVPVRTLYDWIEKNHWHDLIQTDAVMAALNRKIISLLDSEHLSESQLNALDRLQQLKEREYRFSQQKQQPDRQNKNTAPTEKKDRSENTKKSKKGKNDFRDISPQDIEQHFKKTLFSYQLNAWQNRHQRNRFILKSRQIGWTYYSAREAFADALLTGDNQAFLSASKAQANLFKNYIQSFAREWFDIELKGGDKIVLKTDQGDATLFFLSTNSSTAQGPSGHVYMDECFWIRDFKKLKNLAGAIASHKQYRKTYFSTPSTLSHEAYTLWSGKEYESIQQKSPEKPLFKMPTEKQLHQGHLCVDGTYRQIIDIHDAIRSGCDLFDLDQLKLENDPETFAQLYECKFIDDAHSAFLLNELLDCGARDTRYPDYKPNQTRPYGHQPVWIGYDPARCRDSAAIIVLATPKKPGGKFRLFEKILLHNQSWVYQAEVIKQLTQKYQVEHIGIDSTGPGNGVFERVQEFYPAAMNIHYSPQTKTQLVLKAQEIIQGQRIEWDEKHTDIAQAFLSIKKTSTGNAITYVAQRDQNQGHADVAWAIMHALIKEGLHSTGMKQSRYVLGE